MSLITTTTTTINTKEWYCIPSSFSLAFTPGGSTNSSSCSSSSKSNGSNIISNFSMWLLSSTWYPQYTHTSMITSTGSCDGGRTTNSNRYKPSSITIYPKPMLRSSNGSIDSSNNIAITQVTSSSKNPIDDRLTTSSGGASDDSTAAAATTTSSSSSSNDETASISVSAVIVDFLVTLAVAVVSSIVLTYISRTLFKGLHASAPTEDSLQDKNTSETQVYRKLKHILKKRCNDSSSNCGVNNKNKPLSSDVQVPPLSSRELQMADEIIDPDDIECSFTDIGGLDDMKREIYELAILPLIQPQLYNPNSKLVQPVKGILLYGKPGTGKTMMAKALAKESCAIFLPLQLSKILNKYWGESNKLIAATFSLAHKLQPAVIFIDELDTFLKNSNSETAYMDSIKAEFLTLWDGIGTTSNSRVLVLGATNKPQHIDTAILRRMPRAFEVPLPNAAGRLAILQLLFKDENIDETIIPALSKLVEVTEGYSGSDLKELCKAAAMVSVSEHTAEFARRRVMGEPDTSLDEALEQKIRPITENDLIIGLKKVRRTGEAAYKYGKQKSGQDAVDSDDSTHSRQNGNNSDDTMIDIKSLQNFAKLLRALSSQLPTTTSNGHNSGNNNDDDLDPAIPNL